MAKSKWTYATETKIAEVSTPGGTKAEFDINLLDDEDIINKLLYYGLKQKLADSTARPADQKLTDIEAIAQMEDTFERLVDGQWNAEVSGRMSLEKKAKEMLNEEELELFNKLVNQIKNK